MLEGKNESKDVKTVKKGNKKKVVNELEIKVLKSRNLNDNTKGWFFVLSIRSLLIIVQIEIYVIVVSDYIPLAYLITTF